MTIPITQEQREHYEMRIGQLESEIADNRWEIANCNRVIETSQDCINTYKAKLDGVA